MREPRCSGATVAGVLALALAVAPATGCSKHDDSGRPSAIPPLDPNAVPPPPAAPQPSPAPAPSAQAAPEPAAGPAAHEDPGASIKGKIVLSSAIAKTKPQGTLYLTARRPSDNPEARGTLIAVKKLPATTFPLPFEMTAADMPFQTGPFEGDLVLTARIDQDGDPMTHEKGDAFGALPKVRVGAQDVKLTIDQLQKETESLAQPGAMGGPSGPMGGGPHPPMLPPGHP
jgi:hypothetical protein